MDRTLATLDAQFETLDAHVEGVGNAEATVPELAPFVPTPPPRRCRRTRTTWTASSSRPLSVRTSELSLTRRRFVAGAHERTDTFNGYMEGVVRSGRRTAATIGRAG
jgi:hypothetical protein